MTTVARDGEYTPPGRARANGVFLCLVLFCCQAVKTVDPKKATGKLHKLWMDFAKFYEGHGDVANARVIYEKATLVAYRYVQERRGSWGGGGRTQPYLCTCTKGVFCRMQYTKLQTRLHWSVLLARLLAVWLIVLFSSF